MGRDVKVYGINFGMVRERLARRFDEPENRALLEAHIAEWGGDTEEILRKIGSDPSTLTVDQLRGILFTYDDWNLPTSTRLGLHGEEDRYLTDGMLGIRQVFETTATNPSNVIMEVFRQHFGAEVLERLEGSHGFFRLIPAEWRSLLARLVAVTRHFFEQEEGERLAADFPVDPWMENEVAETYRLQHRHRAESPDTYSEKWGHDYFAFSWYAEIFAQLHDTAVGYDEYILVDSY
jgi:hypothetical protein